MRTRIVLASLIVLPFTGARGQALWTVDRTPTLDVPGARADGSVTFGYAAARAIGVVLIRAHSNRIADLRPLVPLVLEAVAASEPGMIRIVGA